MTYAAPSPGNLADGVLPRLLPPAGYPGVDLSAHLHRHGSLPYRGAPGLLLPDVRAAGLTGRGGAAFPVHRKLAAVAAAAGRPVVVGNGAEGEPSERQGQDAAAGRTALGARRIAAGRRGPCTPATPCCTSVAAGRPGSSWRPSSCSGPSTGSIACRSGSPPRRPASWPKPGIRAGELTQRPGALPAFTPPPVFERGVDGRPTLVQNVETLAHLALIARYGPGWFRAAGTPAEPGTMLCTLHQADGSATVAETQIGTTLSALLDLAPAQAVLAGGYHGAWIPAAQAAGLPLSNAALRPVGAFAGAGVLAALPADRCGLAETARVARYLALESAGQCGPCLNGLPRIAAALTEVAGPRPRPQVLAQLSRWSGLVEGRGACHHPDGTVRFVRSALRTFAAEIDRHQRGGCSAASGRPFLPVPAGPAAEADWS